MDTILYFQAAAKTSASDKIAGVLDVAAPAGIHVQAIEETPEAANVADLVEFWKPLGAVVDGGSLGTVDATAFGPLPVVFLSGDPDALPPGAALIRNDSAAIGRLAARELLETGFSDFAFVPNREARHWSDMRQGAFVEALRLNGRACRIMERPAASEAAVEWQRALRRFVVSLPRPCGLFAANDRTAADVLVAARFEGLSVPGDLAVLGVDNFEDLCESATPTLSSIEPDFRGGGRMAAQMLVAAVRSGGVFRGGRKRSFGPLRVVRRTSTRRLATSDKCVAEALDLVRREACSGLRAETVAALFPCSRRMADARFGRAAGRSILAEIHAVRLERAKRLLADTSMPLKILSDFCGFENPNSLRKFFLRETGVTMRTWRRNHARRGR